MARCRCRLVLFPPSNLFFQLMMPEPRPRTRSSGPTLVVVTDDGTILECTPHEIGASRSTRETRWVFVAPDGAEHIGPHYTGFSSVGDIRVLANQWWESRKT